jgi:hypothetical protein
MVFLLSFGVRYLPATLLRPAASILAPNARENARDDFAQSDFRAAFSRAFDAKMLQREALRRRVAGGIAIPQNKGNPPCVLSVFSLRPQR